MAFSPSANISNAVSLSRLWQIYLSRGSGCDCTITPRPYVSDPLIAYVVFAKEKLTGKVVFCGTFNDENDIENILKQIKNAILISVDGYKPSADMVEYIIKYKKDQESNSSKENVQ